jgi:hypothetical protein
VKSARLTALADDEPAPEREASWAPLRLRGGTWVRADGSIDSVQWVDVPGLADVDMDALEPRYYAWVPRLSAGGVRPHSDGDRLLLTFQPFHTPLVICMGPLQRTERSLVRSIDGGLLAHPGGTMGFEYEPHPEGVRLVVAMRAFRPRLPGWLYFGLQAQLHERSTFAFLREFAG